MHWMKVSSLDTGAPVVARKGALAGALAAAFLVAGCSSPATMTPQQKEAFELRRYCEQNPNDVATCLGYLGDH